MLILNGLEMNKKLKVFITGASGFVGKHLVDLLATRGHCVFAGIHQAQAIFPQTVKVVPFHLSDHQSFNKTLKEIQPDAIIHLAAMSKINDSWNDPAYTFTFNTVATIQLIQAAHRAVPQAKIITVGSSEEYGLTGLTGTSLTEDHPCQPQNPYASSKLAMGQVALQLAQKNQQTVIHVRPFNHFGPEQPKGFVISDFASQIVQIEKGLTKPIVQVGDVSAIRDFTDVRDVVNAYLLLLENEVKTGIYNICSGTSRSVKDCLDELVNVASIPIQIIEDKSKFRTLHVPVFLGSSQKINKAVHWEPQIPFRKSLQDTLQYWRIYLEEGS